jgi:ornithine--oxo-acid transaminase
MLRDPSRKKSAERKTGDGNALAQLLSDGHILVDRLEEVVGAQALERSREGIGVPVTREARDEDVVAAVVEIARDSLELARASAHSVKQDDRTCAAFAVHEGERSPFNGDAWVVASNKALETPRAGSQGKFLNSRGVYLLSDRAKELISEEERYGARNYAPLDLVVERAEGVWLWDVGGKRYLDCVSAYSALNVGHCHPRVYAALVEQAQRVTLTSRALRNDRMPGFLELLTRVCEFGKAVPMNTGVEAVETAVKLARRWGYATKGVPADRAEIVVFENNFHGRTMMAVSASTTPEYRAGFGPFLPGFVAVPFGDAGALERAITPSTCAVLLEPIQGEGGVNVPPDGYLRDVRELCTQRNVLFIADEVQTGFGRTGDMFGCDHEAVKPDVLCVGKALGGGYYPVSATLANDDLMRLFAPGDHGSTFGGNPLASAVAEAAIDVIVSEKLPARARRAGAEIIQGLQAIASPSIAQVRGRGLLIGVALTGPHAHALSGALLERGIAAKDTRPDVLRIAPPLIVDDDAIAYLLERFGDAIRTIKTRP